MTITRVIDDGVEFFTLNKTGQAAISESGLARLVGVSQKAINLLLGDDPVRTKHRPESLKPFEDNGFHLELPGENNSKLVKAEVAAVVIEYYAYESRNNRRKEALHAFRKFAKMGIERWIQGITGWVDPSLQPPSPPPLPNLNLARPAIDILKNPNVLSANGYRLYLQIHDADQQHQRPTIAELCKSLKITRPTYHKALNLLDQFNLLPSWVITHNRRQPERFVRDWLQAKIGGQPEAPSPDGPIDLLTDEEVIEVKALHNWKDGIGHVLVKSQNYPDRHKCLLLFGEAGQNLEQIQKRCDEFSIQLGFVPIEFSYDGRTEELQVQLLDPTKGADQTIL
jgi:hypothetical protein